MSANAELYDLHKESDIVIKQSRIRWAGHVQGMTEDRAVTVSYTHLDVYKRQALSSVILCT